MSAIEIIYNLETLNYKFEEEKILNAAYTFEQKVKFRENYRPEFKK